ncbi:MAG: Nif11-like leader peptide family RiPP precursor [Bacillota bacterium]|jgi:predicted ribosomally synthesized peptide with nif11-like leader
MEVNQTVKNFLLKLGEDEELRGKLEAAAKRQDLAECALLSREAGFNFAKADLEYLANLVQAYENGELSEAQLELVSGGEVLFVIGCLAFLALGVIGGAGLVGSGVTGFGWYLSASSAKQE